MKTESFLFFSLFFSSSSLPPFLLSFVPFLPVDSWYWRMMHISEWITLSDILPLTRGECRFPLLHQTPQTLLSSESFHFTFQEGKGTCHCGLFFPCHPVLNDYFEKLFQYPRHVLWIALVWEAWSGCLPYPHHPRIMPRIISSTLAPPGKSPSGFF